MVTQMNLLCSEDPGPVSERETRGWEADSETGGRNKTFKINRSALKDVKLLNKKITPYPFCVVSAPVGS